MEQVTRQWQGEKGASPGTPHPQIRSIKRGYKVMPEFPACANNQDFYFSKTQILIVFILWVKVLVLSLR